VSAWYRTHKAIIKRRLFEDLTGR